MKERKDGDTLKGHRHKPERTPPGQSWDHWNNNISIGL